MNPKSGRGHGRNDLNFARFGFDVTFMIAYGGPSFGENRSTCAPRSGKLKLQHRFSTGHCQVKLEVSSAVLLCDSRRDQSNGLQEGSFIFLFSVSCFGEEVIFFIL